MNKKYIFGFLTAALFLLPLINLKMDRPVPMPRETWEGKQPSFQNASRLIQMNCLNCHSSKTQKPWYSELPLAKQLIQRDTEEGLEEMDMEKEIYQKGQRPSSKILRRMKREIETNAMPPLQYKIMHWHSFISKKDKQALLAWIQDEQAAAALS